MNYLRKLNAACLRAIDPKAVTLAQIEMALRQPIALIDAVHRKCRRNGSIATLLTTFKGRQRCPKTPSPI